MQQRARCISVLNSSLRFLSSEMCSSRQRLERLVSLESSNVRRIPRTEEPGRLQSLTGSRGQTGLTGEP